jgi:hypothetical protein|tara:strand:+ start:135 stop:500 length:366 start_codon:yes stop_codon:yes gene_type:complete
MPYKSKEQLRQKQRDWVRQKRDEGSTNVEPIQPKGSTNSIKMSNPVEPYVEPLLAKISMFEEDSGGGIYAWLRDSGRRECLKAIVGALKPGIGKNITLGPWGPDMEIVADMLGTLKGYGIK